MKYSDARSLIKSGDVLAWTHTGIRGWYDFKIAMVRLFTRSEYTHVGIAWCVAERVFILEAVATGVRIFPLSLDLPCFHLTGNGLAGVQLEIALSQCGKPYSYTECVLGYFGKNDPLNGQWQCAEYVKQVLGLDCDATPSAVVGHLLANGSTLQEITE